VGSDVMICGDKKVLQEIYKSCGRASPPIKREDIRFIPWKKWEAK